MSVTYLANQLNNFQGVTAAGNYNVAVTIDHENVGMIVSYDGSFAPSFMHHFQFVANQSTQSFPTTVPIQANGGMWFFCYLLPNVSLNGNNHRVDFGINAGERGVGMPDEVIRVNVERVTGGQLHSLSAEGDYPLHRGINSHIYELNSLPNHPSDRNKNWQISLSQGQIAGSKILEDGAKLFLVGNDNKVYYQWGIETNLNEDLILSDAEVSNMGFILVAFVEAKTDPTGGIKFEVGDPERDGKAKIVRV